MNFTVLCLLAKVHVGCTSEEIHKIISHSKFHFFHHFAKDLSLERFLLYGTKGGVAYFVPLCHRAHFIGEKDSHTRSHPLCYVRDHLLKDWLEVTKLFRNLSIKYVYFSSSNERKLKCIQRFPKLK